MNLEHLVITDSNKVGKFYYVRVKRTREQLDETFASQRWGSSSFLELNKFQQIEMARYV